MWGYFSHSSIKGYDGKLRVNSNGLWKLSGLTSEKLLLEVKETSKNVLIKTKSSSSAHKISDVIYLK